MSIIYVLIPIAVILVGLAVVIFFWAVKSNQFEDLDRQGYSILFDDDIKKDAQGNNDHSAKNEHSDKSNLEK